MRIAFLTNSLLALESIHFLNEKGVLVLIGTLEKNALLSEQASYIAQQAGLSHVVLQKASLEADLNALVADYALDMVLVQTFPYKIPDSCLHSDQTAFYNLHPGPLPEYRGPDPVFWLLKDKAPECALTLHRMDADFDTGPIIMSERLPILDLDTYGLLNTHLAHAAPELLERFLNVIQRDEPLPGLPQDNTFARYYKKPDVRDLLIDWSAQSAADIQALCRASNPNQNGSIAFFRGVLTRFLEVDIADPEFETSLAPGTIITSDATRGLHIKCVDGQAIIPTVLHVEEGYFSAERFRQVFEVKIGEKFTPPSFVS